MRLLRISIFVMAERENNHSEFNVTKALRRQAHSQHALAFISQARTRQSPSGGLIAFCDVTYRLGPYRTTTRTFMEACTENNVERGLFLAY